MPQTRQVALTEIVGNTSPKNLSVMSLAENAKDLETQAQLLERMLRLPKIGSTLIGSTRRLLNPWLDLNVKLTGAISLEGEATEVDAAKVLEVVNDAEAPERSKEILRYYKLFIDHREVNGSNIVVCTCVPRGLLGLRKQLNYNRTIKTREDVSKAIASSSYCTTDRIAEIYAQVSSVGALNQDIVIIQGLPPVMLGVGHGNQNLPDAGGFHGTKGNLHYIAVASPNKPSTIAHELRHAVQPSKEEDNGYLMMLLEGDAYFSSAKVAGKDQNEKEFYEMFSESIKESVEKGDLNIKEMVCAISSNKNVVEGEIELPMYVACAVFGENLAREICEEYGEEYWLLFMQYMVSKTPEAYLEFWENGTDEFVSADGRALNAEKCYSLIEKGIGIVK